MKTFSQKQIDIIRLTIYTVWAIIEYIIYIAFNAGYVNRWIALILTGAALVLCHYSVRKISNQNNS